MRESKTERMMRVRKREWGKKQDGETYSGLMIIFLQKSFNNIFN
jgi:hypothetical protein